MFGTTPRTVILETRKLAWDREIEYSLMAKKRLVDFERAHRYTMQYDDELKQQHRELQRRAVEARDAKCRAKLATKNESYKELPLLGRIVGEMFCPMVIV